MNPVLDGEASPEDVEHLKIRCLMAKLRADDDQTSVFRIGKWQITNAILQYTTLTTLDFVDCLDFED